MVTEFPIFSKLALQDKQFLDTYNAQFTPYADWVFGTLMTWWDVFGDLEVSLLNENLIIKSSYLSMGAIPQIVLLGDNRIDETIDTIFAYQKENGEKTELYSLPQYTVDAIKNPEKYLIIDDPNAAEYILSAEMHATLSGSRMSAIRKKIVHFEKATEDHIVEFVRMPLDNIHNKMRLINALHTWHDIYRNDSERLEGMIIDRALLTAEHIGLECSVLFIDKAVHGFALYKHITDEVVNISHIKTSFAFPSIYIHVMHTLASQLYKEGATELNIEQDLGIEGLRIYKTRLRPIEMLHKYNVYPRQLE